MERKDLFEAPAKGKQMVGKELIGEHRRGTAQEQKGIAKTRGGRELTNLLVEEVVDNQTHLRREDREKKKERVEKSEKKKKMKKKHCKIMGEKIRRLVKDREKEERQIGNRTESVPNKNRTHPQGHKGHGSPTENTALFSPG